MKLFQQKYVSCSLYKYTLCLLMVLVFCKVGESGTNVNYKKGCFYLVTISRFSSYSTLNTEFVTRVPRRVYFVAQELLTLLENPHLLFVSV